MRFSRLLGHQKDKNVGYWLAVWSIERDRRFDLGERDLNPVEILDTSMGNGDAFAEAGRSRLFAVLYRPVHLQRPPFRKSKEP